MGWVLRLFGWGFVAAFSVLGLTGAFPHHKIQDASGAVRTIKQHAAEIDKHELKKRDALKKADAAKNFKLKPDNTLATEADKQKYFIFRDSIEEAGRIEGEIGKLKESIKQQASSVSGVSGNDLRILINNLSDSHWRVRTAITEALSQNQAPEAEKALAERLGKENEATVKIAIIDGFKARKASSPAAIAALSKILEDKNEKNWAVKMSIMYMVDQNGTKELLIPLAKAMEFADGKLLFDIMETLKKTTGVDKGPQASAWVAYLQEQLGANPGGPQKSIRFFGFFDHPEGQEQLPPQPEAKPTPAQDPPKQDGSQFGTFYGIPVKTKNLVFVIDRSGSMKEKSNWTPEAGGKNIDSASGGGGGGGGGAPDKPDGDLKIDIAKFELIRILKALPDGAMVNIIFFNHAFSVYKDSMVKLDKSTREDMIKFVKALHPEGATNIYDPTEKALTMQAGGGGGGGAAVNTTTDKANSGSADTLFLLTDGKPNFGQIKDPPAIRAKVKELNQLKKITINTIAVTGSDFAEGDAEFLKGIASDNYGQFVKR